MSDFEKLIILTFIYLTK